MDPNGDHMEMHFDYFQIQKWMLQKVRAEKVDEKKKWKKKWVICLVPMFPSWLMVLKLPKKVRFLQFGADVSKISKSVKGTYVHLKVLITLYQKMIWFIGVGAIVYEILATKISKKILIQQKFNKIYRLQTLISPEQ